MRSMKARAITRGLVVALVPVLAAAETLDVPSPKPCQTDADCHDSSYGSLCDPDTMYCGNCFEDADCGPDAICSTGKCVVQCTDALEHPPAAAMRRGSHARGRPGAPGAVGAEVRRARERDTAFAGAAEYAHRHREIVDRFGRFPHRNEVLGRATTPEEEAFLKEPNSRF